MKASELFVKQLEEEGVEYIFGLPGEENLALMEAIRNSKIKFIVTRHEQAAAFMAATYGRLTGRAGVALSTLGPGAANLVTGVAHAQLTGAPLITISGQKAIKENWQAKFQMVDVVSLMRPITKKSFSIIDPGAIPTGLRTAFKLAEDERPGAVHIELPEDVAEEETGALIQTRHEPRQPAPDTEALRQAAEMINWAKNPLIILSSGANRKNITPNLSSFTEKTGIYAVHTQMGKGVLSDDSPFSLFSTGMHRRDYVNCGIDAADLIITIGYNIVEYPPFVWNRELQKKIINIDFSPAEPDKYFNPDVEIIGDVSGALHELSSLIPKRDFPRFRKTRALIEEKTMALAEKKFPLTPPEIVQSARNALRKEDIVTLDNGIYKLWFSRMYKTYGRNTLILDNALATMGAGLPAAIAAKLVYPEKKVVAVVGDGGFMMNSQELETALRNKISVVVVIIRDDAYGFIKWKQKNMKLADFGMDLGNPDFKKYAESYGAVGMKVTKAGEFDGLLREALLSNKLTVIDVPVDYSLNFEVFSEELGNLVCDI
ncbi:MAG: acetolactate synthase large subunit [Patescibacteria group bacterium]|jgi:acetolactate synthase-1/2/3 large subunit